MIVWWLLYCTLILLRSIYWWYETINVTFCTHSSLATIFTPLFKSSWTTRLLTTIYSHACWTMKGYILDKYLHGRYEDGIWSCTLFWPCPLARPAKSVPSNLSVSPPPSLTWPPTDELGLTFALIAAIYSYPVGKKATNLREEKKMTCKLSPDK